MADIIPSSHPSPPLLPSFPALPRPLLPVHYPAISLSTPRSLRVILSTGLLPLDAPFSILVIPSSAMTDTTVWALGCLRSPRFWKRNCDGLSLFVLIAGGKGKDNFSTGFFDLVVKRLGGFSDALTGNLSREVSR